MAESTVAPPPDSKDTSTLALRILRGEEDALRGGFSLAWTLATSMTCPELLGRLLARVRAADAVMAAASQNAQRFFWALGLAAGSCGELRDGSGAVDRVFFDYIGGFSADAAAAPLATRAAIATVAAQQWTGPLPADLGPGYLPRRALNYVYAEDEAVAAAVAFSAGPCTLHGLADPSSAEQCSAMCARALQPRLRAQLVVATAAPASTGPTACVVRGSTLTLARPDATAADFAGAVLLCRPEGTGSVNYNTVTLTASSSSPPLSLTLQQTCNASLTSLYTSAVASVEECYVGYAYGLCQGSTTDSALVQNPVCAVALLPDGGYRQSVSFLQHDAATTMMSASQLQICYNATAANESSPTVLRLRFVASALPWAKG